MRLRIEPDTKCVWLRGMNTLEVPVRHGEGKFIVRDDAVMDRLRANGQIALRYVRPDGSPANGEFPFNPNGAADDIAGICDPSGRIFGLMPHPEAFQDPTNHPNWTRMKNMPEEGMGLWVFRNAVDYVNEELL